MWIDPIVQEVRDAGEQLAKEVNYDLHTFFLHLREKEKKQGACVVSRERNENRSGVARKVQLPQPQP